MPLLFSHLCDLLSALENLSRRDPPLLPVQLRQRYNETIKSWFLSHRISINSPNVDTVALLSALFPARRTDRVYNIQLKRLTKLLKRCLCLGKDRVAILDQWQTPGRGNLCDCVERAMRIAEFPQPFLKDRVTLEEIDDVLASIARRCRFSGPKVRQREVEDDQDVLSLLCNTYQRMQSREAKWFTRLILKDFSCLDLKESMVYYYVDPRLRVAMQMYDEFGAAVTELRSLPASQTIDTGEPSWTQQCANDAHLLPPRTGVKIGPPNWVKAKGGVKHAVSIINGRTMSVEQKHDGEYCQIHIDLARGEHCVQLFSKSGKDSTMDRIGVHQAIKDSLRIGRDHCGFSEKCILEGELLVWSEKMKKVLPFHKIRKHVSRSGVFLGTDVDSQPHPWEKLMIMFYDVLLVDDDPVLHRTHRERRRLLGKLVKPIKGRAGLLWQKHFDFSKSDGARCLKQALAHAFVHRWEGIVLKPSDESYFNLGRPVNGKFSSRWIKLKKDCIQGLGDTADFAVIGAGYDVNEAGRFPDLDLCWTHFYIGCLRNKGAVLHSAAKPHILLFDKLSDSIKKEDMLYLNQHGQFPLRAMELESPDVREVYNLEFASGLARPNVIFRKPFVFDVAGSGFDKSPNRDIFTLRFPRVLRLHRDRDWKHAVGLDELQAMANEAMTAPTGDLSSEITEWIGKLDQLDRGPNGQLPPWDFTDDDEEEPEAYVGEYSTISIAKSSRRARTPAAPPFVRMDTGEMQSTERRLSSGEVAKLSTSEHVVASITTNGSMRTPPDSSPLKQGSDARSTPMSPPCYGRKRTANSIDLEEGSRESKKVRPSLMQSKSEPNATDCSSTAAYKEPLREVINSARPLPQHRTTEPLQQTKQPQASDFSLVPKLPISADNRTDRRLKRKVVMEPSTPAQESTASESTTANNTQQTVPHDADSAPPPKSPGVQNTTAPKLPTPASTPEHPMKDEIIALRQRQVILSPSLAYPYHPLHELLAQHSVEPSPYPTTPTSPASASPCLSILLLVEPADKDLTGKYIWWFVRYLRQWYPRSVRVWDWQVVAAMLKGNIGDDEKVRKAWINKSHAAKMWWDPEEQVVVVRWADGVIQKVQREELDNLDTAPGILDDSSGAAAET